VSVEALVRWQHPRHGLLAPDRFLELAEEHALMHPLTLAVVDHALRQQRAWQRAGLDLVVAVNVSAADLLDSGFPAEIAGRLAAHGTPEGRLRLELTESTVMREEGRALDTLARLSEIGVSLSLDDFGTGYSSLAHLKRLPVQELKIDRSFVLDMLSDRDDAIIVRSTVELGRSLGLRVVAEGVETVEHLEQLRYFGCHVAQGFVFSRPCPPRSSRAGSASRARSCPARRWGPAARSPRRRTGSRRWSSSSPGG
jgi:EAL domain-containing protein (putative c-di-GMP-specific phosphodiesterase class I)